MTFRLLAMLLLVGTSVSACAQSAPPADAVAANAPAAQGLPPRKALNVPPGSAAARAIAALKQINPQIEPDQIMDAPIAGFQQAVVAGQVVYVSNDGKYLMQGPLYDIQAQKDVGAELLNDMRRDLVATVPVSDRIVFAPADPKYTVTVFTDVECGYCRKFHSEIAQYNKQGIAVQYVAFPRMGPASEDFRKMESVWCASDRKKALADAKHDRKLPPAGCKNPVAMQYDIGQRAGLTGTPMILAENGAQLGGYLPPAELRAALDRNAAASKTGAQAQGKGSH